ncbi:MAG TPA: hypothetical protein VMG12_20590 [Polyangiaceae bacterium]|nr:hypothetical protein [Polyangiaceae bacterium]
MLRLTISSGLVAALLVTGAAGAQVKKHRVDGASSYAFDDDPLSADVSNANTAPIRVRVCGGRSQLLRPRISFVPEMLKSVASY